MKPLSARIVPSLLLAALVAGLAPAAGAQDRGRGNDRRESQRDLADSVRRVERQSGGQVLSAERVPFDGRDVNRVKVVDAQGRVRVYMDDPQGGRDRGPRPERTRRDDGNSD